MINFIAAVEKFSEYIFKPGATHGKDHVFRSLGYDGSHSASLSALYSSQAAVKHAALSHGAICGIYTAQAIKNGNTMISNHSRVKLMTNNYSSEGAHAEDMGYIIEVYPDGAYEVEFSNANGVSFAQIVAQEGELQLDEPQQASEANPLRRPVEAV